MYADIGWGWRCDIARFDRNRLRLVDRRTVRELIGIKCDDTLRKWINEGIFPQPHVNPAGRHQWRLAEVLDWIKQRPRRRAQEAA